MAWNKPNSGEAESFPLQGKKKPSILKRKGFTPVATLLRKARSARGIFFSIFTVAIAGIAVLLYFAFSNGDTVPSTRPQTPETKHQPPNTKHQAPSTNAVPKAKDPHEGYVLSPAGVWQPTNRPWRADAKKVHTVHTNWSHSAVKNVPYRNAVEQMLLATFKCPRGTCPPPYVRIPQKDMERLVEILIDKPTVSEDDTLAQIKDKEVIATAKKQLMEYIRKGGKPEFFFKAYHNDLQKAYEKRTAVIREISRITTEEGDAGLAKDFQDEMNKRLKKEGIRPIHMDIK